MEGGTISGNKAPFGGGIGINDYLLSNDRGSYPESTWRRFFPTKVTINNGTITGNHAVLTGHKVNNDPYAENGVGGGIYVASQEVTINGANITNNTAGKQGGGVYVAAVPYRLQMGKTMVTGNTATKLGGGMWLCPTGSAKTAITNGASFFDNTAGTGANNNDTTAAGDDVASISKNDPATQTLILSNNGLDNWLVHWYEDGKIDNSYLGASNGSDRYPNTVNPPVDRGTLNGITDNISLKSIMSDQGKAAARTSAKVVVTGNKAPRGGGIGSNGEVDFGTSPINYDKIKLEVTKKWETDNNDHVTSVTVGLFRVTKSVIDGVVLKDANGNPIDTTDWTASQLSEAKIKQLMESGSTDYQQIDQVVLNDANNWKHSFVDLIKFNMVNDAQDTNNPFIYVVREMDSNGNWVQNESKATFGTQTIKVAYEIVTEATGDSKQTISNNVAPEEMNIEVKKDWVGKKASEVKVQLYKNGAPLGTVVTLNAANNWTTRFENLLVKDAGAANNNEYKVLEVGESNGEITINGSTYKVTYGEIDQDGKTVITNAEKPKPNPKNPPKKVKRTPKTGDANHVVFFTILGIGALASLGFVYGVKRKYM
jgi:putative LPXTG-motif protein cell wall anchor domain protein